MNADQKLLEQYLIAISRQIVRNSVFDCHLSPVGRQNSVSNNFLFTFVDSINVSDCRLKGVESTIF